LPDEIGVLSKLEVGCSGKTGQVHACVAITTVDLVTVTLCTAVKLSVLVTTTELTLVVVNLFVRVVLYAVVVEMGAHSGTGSGS
jgi:hypothetical protein